MKLEFFLIILTIFLLINYYKQFKNDLDKNSYTWFILSLSSLALAILSFVLQNTSFDLFNINLLLFYSILIIPSYSLSIYLLNNYIGDNENKHQKNKVIISFIALLYISYLFIFFASSETINIFLKVIIISTFAPLLYTLTYYLFSKSINSINYSKISIIIVIWTVGIGSGILFKCLSFLPATYIFLSLILYINKYKEIINIDHLTGTYNRRFIDNYSNERKDYSLLVCFIDIDKFKNINDTYGHQYGDKALIDVANILKSSLRATDLVIRYGGDEFLVIAKIKNKSNSKVILNNINKNLEEYNKISSVKIGLSIGYDIYNDNKVNFDDFIKAVDKKMYNEKNKKKKQ